MSTTVFNTDTEVDITVSTTFFAHNSTEADGIAQNFIVNALGNAGASMCSVAVSSSVLSAQNVVGSNYTYTWTLNLKNGDSGATPAQYVSISAEDAESALASLQDNAQRVTQKNSTPLKVNYLHS